MSVKGGYIGNVVLQAWFMDHGPFSTQAKQEASTFMSPEAQKYIVNNYIEGLPEPIGGVRLVESLRNYNNHLKGGEIYLEDAEYEYTDPTQNTPTSANDTPMSSANDTPTSANDTPMSSANDTPTSANSDSSTTREEVAQPAAKQRAQLLTVTEETEKNFFTWQVSENLFNKVVGADFTDAQKMYFTYDSMTRPEDTSTATFLAPFFTKNIDSSTGGDQVHWGASTLYALPANQPFEVTYKYSGRVHNVPFEVYPEDIKYPDINVENLKSSAYLAINFGAGSPGGDYLLLFMADKDPTLYRINGNKTTFVSAFDDPSLRKRLFDLNSQFFSVKIEPVIGSFIITSNLFSKPWIIVGGEFAQKTPETKDSPVKGPYFSGAGQLKVYGGNVQAGWCFRPIQYIYEGAFDTPKTTFSTTTGTALKVKASLTLKGTGDSVTGRGTGGILMADCESLSGAEGGGRKFTTGSQQPYMNRKIIVKIKKNMLKGVGSSSLTKGLLETYAGITLIPSSVITDSGFVISEGRSPYIWMNRLESPTKKGGIGIKNLNVTGDVLSLQLSYNANTYNEVTQTGTLKMLNPMVINKPRGGRLCDNGVKDYQTFMNRAVYVKIGCHFENGQGLDGTQENDWLFEGMTVGSEIAYEAGRQIIVFKLSDYMNVLEHTKFELCPYYDGMVAKYVVKDIVETTGFPTNRIRTGKLPISSTPNMANDYVLPYVDLRTEPQFKYADGSSYKEGIMKVAKMDFKTVFFDRFGNFHYDQAPDILGGGSPAPKVRFFTNPRNAPTHHQIAFNSATLGRAVNDVYNIIRVDSIDRILQIRVTANSRYEAGISNPLAVGYLGFRKMLLVREPALGSVKAVYKYAQSFQRKMHIPPKTIRFECFGRYDLQPMDIVALDNQRVRVMNISHEILAAENKFWMTIDGEWFEDLSTANPTASPSSSANS